MKQIDVKRISGIQNTVKSAIATLTSIYDRYAASKPEEMDELVLNYHLEQMGELVMFLKDHSHDSQREIGELSKKLTEMGHPTKWGQMDIWSLREVYRYTQSNLDLILDDINAVSTQAYTALNYDQIWRLSNLGTFLSGASMVFVNNASNTLLRENLVMVFKMLSLGLPEAAIFYGARVLEWVLDAFAVKRSIANWPADKPLGPKVDALKNWLTTQTGYVRGAEVVARLEIVNKYTRIGVIHKMDDTINQIDAERTIIGDFMLLLDELISQL
ncbi:MAG: hypothetical protein WC400_01120 [Patescibacteria group bacterium]|jgi:hypothetical protein